MVRAATEVWHECDYLFLFSRLLPRLKLVAMRRTGDLMQTGAQA